jgi:hypothetical protein
MSERERRQCTRFDLEILLSIQTLELPRTRARTGKTENISATGEIRELRTNSDDA